MMNGQKNGSFKVVIVGCGLGGLACAIQCRREGLEVLMLEKMPELSELGAGIQLPPNATKVMQDFGLLDKLKEAGLTERNVYDVLRWQDGRVISACNERDWNETLWGNASHVMHRADYQRVLIEEAQRLGAEIRLGCDVVEVQCESPPTAVLATGERISGDVLVGGDGLRSSARTAVLGYVKEPEESGDLAYRVTLPRELLENEPEPFINDIVKNDTSAIWWGPNAHVVLYSIRHGAIANLVLCCPDNLPPDVSRQSGDLAEMKMFFKDWDPRLKLLLNKVDHALKWKIWKMEALDRWVRGSVALLGDACHPSVPYAASGAAMAVEDGIVLGRLLGLFSRSGESKKSIPELLQLYQDIRKERATITVDLANDNRKLYHMEDGEEQEKRDRDFAQHSLWDKGDFPWAFADYKRCKDLFAFDALGSANDGFAKSRFAKPLNSSI